MVTREVMVLFLVHLGLADLCWPGLAGAHLVSPVSCQAVSGRVRPQSKLCKSEAGGDY